MIAIGRADEIATRPEVIEPRDHRYGACEDRTRAGMAACMVQR